MSTVVSNQFRQFLEKIVTENGLKVTDINYDSDSENGEGFISNNLTVDVQESDKSLYLFCKSYVKTNRSSSLSVDKMFANEIYFYKTIYPAYQEFLKERGVDDGFINVPKCYGVEEDIIALENLKLKGYDLFEKENFMNADHILFTMKTLGKFHAISFAFKDQKHDLYDSFIRNIQSCFTDMVIQAGYNETLAADMRSFLRSLDSVEDKYILDACGDLVKTLIDAVLNVEKYTCNNPVIIQGDCWCNNVMYLYDGENKESPTDIMLVDWQVLRNGSPTFDLAYFFYSVTTESTLENLEYYLSVYHDELSKRIKQLGSDPEALYPYTTLKEEWKKFAKYALAQGFFVIKSLVADKEEQSDFYEYWEIRDKVANTEEAIENFMPKIKNEHVFFARIKAILKHFIKHNFL